jgi:hypothetical protein
MNPNQERAPYSRLRELVEQYQKQTSKIGLGKARLTLYMLDAAQPLSPLELAVIGANREVEEHTIVALLFWLRSLPHHLRTLVDEAQLALVPLRSWDKLKTLFDTIRLQAGTSQGAHLREWAGLVRKISSLTGRDLRSADWEQEKERLKVAYANRMSALSPTEYYSLFLHCARGLIAELEPHLVSKRHTTIEEWWKTRVATTPAGSSSWRSLASEFKTKSHKSADRPNKRVLYSLLPQESINWITNQQPRCHARTSTKPEPGRKRRALYAADDLHTIISSFSSWGFEDAMRFDGMVAKQSPSDILQWLQLHNTSLSVGGHWLSLDYTDFNKEHHWWEQSTLNLLIAAMWARQGPKNAVARQKTQAALWLAASYRNRTAMVDNKMLRIHHGLFSGERNTARDNTLLHNIYKRMMLLLTPFATGTAIAPLSIMMCGDDEDGWHASQEHAVAYYATGVAVGWHYNKVKQLMSRDSHEFLQVMASANSSPTQPLAAAVVAYITGNWYKSPTLDLLGLPSAMMSTTIELVARGATKDFVFNMTRRYLNSLFKYQYGRSIRWDALLTPEFKRRYSFRCPNEPKLAQHSIGVDEISPQLRNEVSNTKSHGIRELVAANWDIVQHIPQGQRMAAIKQVAFDTYKNWYTTAINSNMVHPKLPCGRVSAIDATCRTATLQQTLDAGLHLVRPPDHLTVAQAAAIAGIPLAFYTALDPITLAKTGNQRLNAAISAVQELEPNSALIGLKTQVSSSMPWYS